jgi:hypothetical protein
LHLTTAEWTWAIRELKGAVNVVQTVPRRGITWRREVTEKTVVQRAASRAALCTSRVVGGPSGLHH